jgi:hypothetical protein
MVPETAWHRQANPRWRRTETTHPWENPRFDRAPANPTHCHQSGQSFPLRSNKNIVRDSEMGVPRAHTTSATPQLTARLVQRTSCANRVGSKKLSGGRSNLENVMILDWMARERWGAARGTPHVSNDRRAVSTWRSRPSTTTVDKSTSGISCNETRDGSRAFFVDFLLIPSRETSADHGEHSYSEPICSGNNEGDDSVVNCANLGAKSL